MKNSKLAKTTKTGKKANQNATSQNIKKPKNLNGLIHYGMAGFAYEKWRKEGVFYPQEAKSVDEKLSYYASVFNSMTLCLTFNYNPPASLFHNFINLTKSQNPNFVFNLYAPQTFTDSKSISASLAVWDEFWNGTMHDGEEVGGIKYFHENGALGCLLLRFCSCFDNNVKNMNKILKITKRIPRDVRIAFIFMHSSWFNAATREIFKNKNWCLATSFITNNLVDAGTFGNIKSTKTTHRPKLENTSNFIYIAFNGSYGPETGSYDKNGFLEYMSREVRKFNNAGKEIFCSFDNTFETTYKYPLPGLLIHNYYLCPQMAELPPDSDGIDRQCCLHDALKMKKLLEKYTLDNDGYIKVKFV